MLSLPFFFRLPKFAERRPASDRATLPRRIGGDQAPTRIIKAGGRRNVKNDVA